MKSGLFSIGTVDLLKGLIMAGIAAILTSLYQLIQTGIFPTTLSELKPVLLAGVGAMLAYILKNFFTNNKNQFAKKDK